MPMDKPDHDRLDRLVADPAPAAPLARVMLRLTIAFILMLAGVTMFQDQSLYYPDKAPLEALVSGPLRAWPTPDDFRGLVAEPAGPVRGTAVVFHGNAGHAGHRGYYAAALTRLGLRVILAEYPGYGPRDGKPGERTLVDDADATVALAHRLYGAPLLLVGESLGAGVVAAVAERQRDRLASLLLVTPWDRLENVAAFHFPWLPVRWLLHDRYDSAAHLTSFDRPVLVVVAERDSIVPARFGAALYEGLTGPKRQIVVPAADHNDWVEHVDDRWWNAVVAFLLGEDR